VVNKDFHSTSTSKVTQGHRQCHPLLDCLGFLSETVKVDYTYFQTELAQMTLRDDLLKVTGDGVYLVYTQRRYWRMLHGFTVIQGHRNWYHRKARVRLPINLPL